MLALPPPEGCRPLLREILDPALEWLVFTLWIFKKMCVCVCLCLCAMKLFWNVTSNYTFSRFYSSGSSGRIGGARKMIFMRLPYDLFLQCPGWGGSCSLRSPPPAGSATVLCHTANDMVFRHRICGKKTPKFTLSVRFILYSFGVLGTRLFTHPVVRFNLDFYPLGGRSDLDLACLCFNCL